MKKTLIYLITEFGFTKALAFVDSAILKVNRGIAAISLYQILTATLLGVAGLNITGLLLTAGVYWEVGSSLNWPWISLFSVFGTLSVLGLIGGIWLHRFILTKQPIALASSENRSTAQIEVLLLKWLEESVANDDQKDRERALQDKIDHLEKSVDLMSEAISEMNATQSDENRILRRPLG